MIFYIYILYLHFILIEWASKYTEKLTEEKISSRDWVIRYGDDDESERAVQPREDSFSCATIALMTVYTWMFSSNPLTLVSSESWSYAEHVVTSITKRFQLYTLFYDYGLSTLPIIATRAR